MRNVILVLAVSLLLPLLAPAQASSPSPLSVGDLAPDFSLPYATKDSIGSGELVLSGFKEKIVVLAFYPADWSGGCTKEVCTLRDNFVALAGLKADILAISGDYPYSHHEWAKYHDLQFPLLSDHRHKVATMYHSFNESSGYNKRTVYVVDRGRRIAYIDLEYSTQDNASFDKLKSAVERIGGKK
jgi:peroxiredoxin